jgi:hypothetical protein
LKEYMDTQLAAKILLGDWCIKNFNKNNRS